MVSGTNLFSTLAQNPRAIRALVFLSDGRDTSSVNTRDVAQVDAQARNVQLYALGVGEVFQEEQLREMAGSTGAGFVLANGSMSSNTSGEGEIRKNIVEADLVDCIIALPAPGRSGSSPGAPYPARAWPTCT